jgi:uncharacterized membrane protein YuzA (DUF378 family)
MIKDKNTFFAIGQISLAISILLNHFAGNSSMISFSIGFLTGLSIVFNIAYFILFRKEKSRSE